MPVAVNCRVSPFATEGLTGVVPMETSVGAVTVSVTAGLVTPPEAAVICEVPCPTPLARPPALIVATAVLELAHAAVPVMFCVEPSV